MSDRTRTPKARRLATERRATRREKRQLARLAPRPQWTRNAVVEAVEVSA